VFPTSNQDGRQAKNRKKGLSLAVVAILVGGMKCRTQIWKGTTQGSSQQSLVEIGSVVSEEKMVFKFHPPFFLICIIGKNRQKFKVHKKSCNICLKAHHYIFNSSHLGTLKKGG
jgi:hypothetical protein